ncbi:MAG: hypothetical protein V1925_02540 [Candidatus Omnitrophota bacterium]
MKLSKFLSITIFITAFSLLYVYQQTEIFRLAYTGYKKQGSLEDLLDKNCFLRYNIEENASLARIGDTISGCADFQMPDSFQLVRLLPSAQGAGITRQASEKTTLLSRIFGIKRQAEARTVSP